MQMSASLTIHFHDQLKSKRRRSHYVCIVCVSHTPDVDIEWRSQVTSIGSIQVKRFSIHYSLSYSCCQTIGRWTNAYDNMKIQDDAVHVSLINHSVHYNIER